MKTIKGLCEELSEKLELPPEALGDTLRLTALGKKRLLVERHRGVLEYGDERIRIASAQGELVISGSELSLSAMNRDELLITGKLQRLEWE